MADLSTQLSTILIERHSAKPLAGEEYSSTAVLDSFLKEAYQINRSITTLLSYLRAIRTPYLSSAPAPPPSRRPQSVKSALVPTGPVPEHLTDTQREAIDGETSSVLREINTQITNISRAVDIQHDTSTKILEKKYGKPNSAIWRWAAGEGDTPDAGKSDEQITEEGKVKTQKTFRDGVLWYLSNRLKESLNVQQEMVEQRLNRERDKQMSILHDPRNKGVKSSLDFTGHGNRDLRGHDKYNPALDPSQSGEQELTPEQLQLFEEENRGIFEHFNDQLAKVTQVEKSLMEIGSLQQTLVGHLSVQGEMIGQLVEDAASTDENVRKGNKELQRASERASTARLVFFATIGLCSFLVVWDLVI
ncbi:hypothetical protein B0A52_01685 [Exophiala mesophila]|uniref:t-SNARE coiled-coil homology domain-containing protein n=1 Tax=Exophiala mesophila TaxID=212818 RepID=A0A438NFQ0_EXOME|nr:hypothetical protein B0A52_01685 [Exophiala mesophila]